MTRHPQVPFKTLDGDIVGVDVDMLPILNTLKELGITTFYSCQNDRWGSAYVMVPIRSARRLEKLAWRRSYSRATQEVLCRFAEGRFEIKYTVFRTKKSTTRPGWKNIRTVWKKDRIVNADAKYAIKRLIDNHYGFRTVYRWPAEDSADVLAALTEISQELHGV